MRNWKKAVKRPQKNQRKKKARKQQKNPNRNLFQRKTSMHYVVTLLMYFVLVSIILVLKSGASSIVALGNMGDTSVVDDLIARVTDPSKDNRVLMIQALAKLGDPKASKALFSILEEAKLQSLAGTSGSYLGFHCVQALAQLGEGEVVQYLLQDWSQDMEVAMEALGTKALPYLERTVQNSKDGQIRALAVQLWV